MALDFKAGETINWQKSLLIPMTVLRMQRRPSRTAGPASVAWTQRLYGQRRRVATAAAALLAVAVGYHVVFGQNGITAYEQKRHEEKALTVQVQQLTQENDSLSGHVQRLENDPGAIEHQAREELHYTRPDEVIVTLQPEPRSTK